jgi:Arc/MetJ family transcription regulator
MLKRTTLEIDDELLARAKRALGSPTTRATVEEALRRAFPSWRASTSCPQTCPVTVS